MLKTIFLGSTMALACYAQGSYTADQARAGRAAYQASCAGCHGADLSGLNSASALAGGLFMSSWGDRTPSDLVSFLEGAMPPGNPGSLGEQAYVNVTAFILDFNGAHPGNQPLTAASKFAIRSIATGQAKAAAAPGEPLGGRAEAPVPATPRGLVVAGEVKNFTPVTDAMLRNPDPERLADDSPRLSRHQLQHPESDHHSKREGSAAAVGVGHERRHQSTRAGGPRRHHVHHESRQHRAGAGRAQRANLIWENRVGKTATGNSQRGLAIYGDKVYVTTSDAHIYALDARTGKNVWDTVIGDRKQSNYSTSSGPIVINGKVVQGLGGVREVSRREMLHQRLRCGNRKRSLEVLHHREGRRTRAATVGVSCRICSARAAKPGSPAAMIPT